MTTASRAAVARRQPAAAADDEYLSMKESAHLLEGSLDWRRRRLDATDMLTTDETANLLGTSRVTINKWINEGRCVAVEGPTRGRKLPRWQFEPKVLDRLPSVLAALGDDHDGWMQLAFLESPLAALGGRTPRQALEQGEVARVEALAAAFATSDV